ENDVVQRVEPRLEELAMRLDPLGLGFQAGLSQSACPHASHLLCGDEPGLLQDADVLLHARQRHLELLGEARDRRFRPSKLLDHAAAGSVGKRPERKIEIRGPLLNHMVQYYAICRRAQERASKAAPHEGWSVLVRGDRGRAQVDERDAEIILLPGITLMPGMLPCASVRECPSNVGEAGLLVITAR